MKSDDWPKWTGNRTAWQIGKSFWSDAYMTQPEQDRGLLEVFTTALNDNATRGQLPINQSGLAAWSAVLGGMLYVTNTTPDQDVINNAGPSGFGWGIIEPAGVYDAMASNNWPAAVKMVNAINRTRSDTNIFASQTFTRLGDLLATPELTEKSPFLNLTKIQKEQGLNDAVMEWLPQQMLSLVRVDEPRFVVYSYGQTLKPANHSILTSGSLFGMCTNYQITAEVVTRAVVKVIGSPDPDTANPNSSKYQADPDKRYPLRAVTESYNIVSPE
jgi:hypothetical protein